MSKPENITEAIRRAREYGTPTYMMLADEIGRLRAALELIKHAESKGQAKRIAIQTKGRL